METAVFSGIIFLIIGFTPLIYFTVKENRKIFLKIMISALCGVFIMAGLVLLVSILLK